MKPSLFIALIFSSVSLLASLQLFGGRWQDFIQFPGLLLVCVGTFSTLFMSYNFQEIKKSFLMLFHENTTQILTNPLFLKEVLMVSQVLRKDGFNVLESLILQVKHPYLLKYLKFLFEGMDKNTFIEILNADLLSMEEELGKNAEVFETASLLSPIFGMIGAVLGLIPVFTDLANTQKLGIGLVSAFVTLVYGLAFAYMFFYPLSIYLKQKSVHFKHSGDFFKICILSLHEGVSPVVLEEKLKIYSGQSHS